MKNNFMEVLLTLKPKIGPYIMIICALAVLVAVIALALAALYEQLRSEILMIGLGVLLILGLLVMQQFYRKWYTTYEITEHDVIWRFGVFAPDEHIIPVDEITNIKVDRSFLGIVFGFADLLIDTASAKTEWEVEMKDIDAAQINQAVELLRFKTHERHLGSRRRGKEPDSEAQ
jgi:uncharacterized membrane protein YdbT with pleckstrin-like domain